MIAVTFTLSLKWSLLAVTALWHFTKDILCVQKRTGWIILLWKARKLISSKMAKVSLDCLLRCPLTEDVDVIMLYSLAKVCVSLQRRWFDLPGLYLHSLHGQPVINPFHSNTCPQVLWKHELTIPCRYRQKSTIVLNFLVEKLKPKGSLTSLGKPTAEADENLEVSDFGTAC